MVKICRTLIFLFGLGLIGSVFAGSLYSQDLGVRVPIKNISRPEPSSESRNSSRSQVKIQKVTVIQREVVRETKIVKTSNLVVTSETGATVSLISSVKSAKPKIKDVIKDNVEFEDLRPGKYTVTASLEGYKTQETEIYIKSQKTTGISLELEPYQYQLTIQTNIEEGEVRFAPARLDGIDEKGRLKTTEIAGNCIVKIKDKKAVIKDLTKGYYNIDIRPAAVEYEQILTAINVPQEILSEKDPASNEKQSYRIDLEKKISEGTFNSVEKDNWVLPNGWQFQDRVIKTTGLAGIALPRSEQQYGYYTNFEMTSDVILTDGKTIGFALRASDSLNYYLVQISGANAAEPFLASGFVVKNGKKSPALFSNPIDHFAKTIKSKKSFRVFIKGEENIFKIFIEDSQNGDRLEVGNMIDDFKIFHKGAVGIVGSENSNSEIGSFTVCAKLCR